MESGVNYFIKHSGEFLYKISNEEDKINFKITKIRIPSEIKHIPNPEDSKMIKDDSTKLIRTTKDIQGSELTRLGKRDYLPESSYLAKR